MNKIRELRSPSNGSENRHATIFLTCVLLCPQFSTFLPNIKPKAELIPRRSTTPVMQMTFSTIGNKIAGNPQQNARHA